MNNSLIPSETIVFKGKQVKVLGDSGNLQHNLLGVLCSQKCPGELILKAYDKARQLRDEKRVIVSGFHSPIEKDLFDIFLRGSQPIVYCMARDIDTFRIPIALRERIEQGQLTIIAPSFIVGERRLTRTLSNQRNEFIFTICDEIFLIHAFPGGNLESILRKSPEYITKIFTIESAYNKNLYELGVKSFL